MSSLDKKIDHDTKWKEIIEQLFEDFVAFFMPDLFPEIDFSRKPDFLKQELHKIVSIPERKGMKINDSLVKVFLKNGKEQWILIHIEIQEKHETEFSERMFTYYYRIYDKFKIKEITAIALFVGENIPKNHKQFSNQYFGTKINYEYNTYIVKEQNEKQLLKSKNPFAIAVLAALHIIQTKKDLDNRLKLKTFLINFIRKRAKQGNFPDSIIVHLVQFVMNLMVLDKKRETQFQDTFYKPFQKKNKMTITEYDKQIIKGMNLAYYGMTFEEMQKKTEEKALLKQNIQMILKLHYQLNMQTSAIATFLEVNSNFVEKVLREHKQS